MATYKKHAGVHNTLIALALCVVVVFQTKLGAQDRAGSRTLFASRMSSIKEGMSSTEVERILGRADKIVSQDVDGLLPLFGTKEIWYYGAKEPLFFPSLGRIYFRASSDTSHSEVMCIAGAREPSLKLDAIEEHKITKTLTSLGYVTPCFSARYFDPKSVIAAVNAMSELEKDQVFLLVDEFLRISPEDDSFKFVKIRLALRVLFELKDGTAHPEMGMGRSDPPAPEDPKAAPAFPLVLISDVPMLVCRGYSLTGKVAPIDDDILFYKAEGILRHTKLEPLDEPFDVFESILKTPGWTYSKRSEEDETLIALQLLRLVDYERDKEKDRWSLLDFSVKIGSRSRFSEFRKSQIGQYRWSEQGNKYIKRIR